MSLKIMTVLAIGMLAGSCSKDRDSKTDAAATQPVEPPVVEGVATVDGQPISKQDFLFFVEPYADHMKDTLPGREHALHTLIDQVLLEREAKRLTLHEEDRYKWKMQEYSRNLLITRLTEVHVADLSEVTEKEAREYFDTHPEDFDHPERVQLKHILVETEEEARAALARLKKGEPFEKVAIETSLDLVTRDRGGNLGLLTRKERPNLAEAAFSLSAPGEITGPVQSPAGIHIIQLVRKLPARKDSFEDIKPSLIVRLRNRRLRDAKRDMVKTLREGTPVELNRVVLQELNVPLER